MWCNSSVLFILWGCVLPSDSPITLQHGVIEFGFAWNQTYKYYVIDVPSGGDLRVSLGVISGDADLYVNVYDPSNPLSRPTTNNYTWMSNGFGDDSLNVTHGTYVAWCGLELCPAWVLMVRRLQAGVRVSRDVHHWRVRLHQLRVHHCGLEFSYFRPNCD
jgi:hypothetical protein